MGDTEEKTDVSKEKISEDPPWYKRHDVLVLVVGHLFFGAIAGAIFGLGECHLQYYIDVCI